MKKSPHQLQNGKEINKHKKNLKIQKEKKSPKGYLIELWDDKIEEIRFGIGFSLIFIEQKTLLIILIQ